MSASDRQKAALERLQSIRSSLLTAPVSKVDGVKQPDSSFRHGSDVQTLLSQNNALLQCLLRGTQASGPLRIREEPSKAISSYMNREVKDSLCEILELIDTLDSTLFSDYEVTNVRELSDERICLVSEGAKKILSELQQRSMECSKLSSSNPPSKYGTHLLEITERLESANQTLKSEAVEKDREIQLLKDNEADLRNTLDELLSEKSELHEKYLALQQCNGAAQLDTEVLLKKCKELNSEIEILRKAVSEKEEEQVRSNGEKSLQEEQFKKEMEKHVDKVVTLEKECSSLSAANDELLTRLALLEQERSYHLDEIAELKRSNDKLRSDLQSFTEKSNVDNENASSREAEQKNAYLSLQGEKRTTEEERDTLKTKCADLLKEKESLEQQLKNSLERNAILEKKQQSSVGPDSSATDLATANKKINELKLVIESMTKDVSSQETNIGGNIDLILPKLEVKVEEYPKLRELSWLNDSVDRSVLHQYAEVDHTELYATGLFYQTVLNALEGLDVQQDLEQWKKFFLQLQCVLDIEGGNMLNAFAADTVQIWVNLLHVDELLNGLTSEELLQGLLLCLFSPLCSFLQESECERFLSCLQQKILPIGGPIHLTATKDGRISEADFVDAVISTSLKNSGFLNECLVLMCCPETSKSTTTPTKLSVIVSVRLASLFALLRNASVYVPLFYRATASREKVGRKIEADLLLTASVLSNLQDCAEAIGGWVIRFRNLLDDSWGDWLVPQDQVMSILKGQRNANSSNERTITLSLTSFKATQYELLTLYNENSKYSTQLDELLKYVESIE